LLINIFLGNIRERERKKGNKLANKIIKKYKEREKIIK
jgi:hypothetical protein